MAETRFVEIGLTRREKERRLDYIDAKIKACEAAGNGATARTWWEYRRRIEETKVGDDSP